MKKYILATVALLAFSGACYSKEIGKWYDDLGSANYGDASLIIEEEAGNYFIVRKNGDGSGSRYKLEKRGDSYIKVGDRFGAKYVVTKDGLELHDKQGYIRTAKPKN